MPPEPPAPAPEEEVKAVLAGLATAAKEPTDVDKMMAAFSDSYADSQGGNKAGVRSLIEGLVAQGVMANVNISVEGCEVVVDGDNATARPVRIQSPMGSQSYVYKFKKEADGVWRIINNEMVY